ESTARCLRRRPRKKYYTTSASNVSAPDGRTPLPQRRAFEFLAVGFQNLEFVDACRSSIGVSPDNSLIPCDLGQARLTRFRAIAANDGVPIGKALHSASIVQRAARQLLIGEL